MADPISATGLALAVVPLLISAFENYEITFQPFITYYRHVREVERFLTRLGTQKTIFLNECELLFAAIGNGVRLADVLGDPNHPCRKDEEMSIRLETLLGSSAASCVSLLTLINDTLNKITLETKGFQSLLEEKPTRKSKGKSSLSLFRQKVKISFSKTRLNDTVDELRRYSEDLVVLSRQIRELAGQKLIHYHEPTPQTKINTHFQVVKDASTKLHDVLCSKWPCNELIEHMAGMSLFVQDAERWQHKVSKVDFNLVLTCRQDSTSQLEPIWLRIESALNEQDDPEVTITRKLLDMLPTPPGSQFISSVAHAVLQDGGNLSDPVLDLGAIGRLCQYFQRRRPRSVLGEQCFGLLERTETFKHFVYPSPAPLVSTTTIVEKRLKDVLQEDFEERRQEAWGEKLSLAKLLALAVLRFQATPWLAESWSSSDIYLYGPKQRPTDDIASLGSPYLNVKLAKANTLPAMQQPAHKKPTASSIAPNPSLFSLGVILLELGYDAPLEALRREEDVQHGATNPFINYFTAKRLGKTVSKRLNTRYGKLVERCLSCDFGVGTELAAPALQNAVVANVVNELDECLKDFDRFNALLPPLKIL